MAKAKLNDRIDWFPCYPKEFLGALQGMPPDEGLLYTITLLRIYECWGPCRDPDESLMRRTGLPRRRFQIAMDALVAAGRIVKTDLGFTNPRATEVMRDQEAFRKRMRDRSTEGWKKRKQKTQTDQQTEASSAYGDECDKRIRGKEDKRIQEKDSGKNPRISHTASAKKPRPVRVLSDWPANYEKQFWDRYPRRTEKAAAMRKLGAVKNSGLPWARFWAGVLRYAAYCVGTEQAYIKHPTTWLNKGCWDDELGKPRAQQERRSGNGAADLLAQMMGGRDDERTDDDAGELPADRTGDVVDLPHGSGYRRH